MIDICEKTNCFDSVCEYADSRGIVRQRRWIESQSESEHATSVQSQIESDWWTFSSIHAS